MNTYEENEGLDDVCIAYLTYETMVLKKFTSLFSSICYMMRKKTSSSSVAYTLGTEQSGKYLNNADRNMDKT